MPFYKREDPHLTYDFGKELGSGTFATVVHGTNKKNAQEVAIKMIEKSAMRENAAMIKTEVEILKRVRHEHIIHLKEMYETSSHIYLIMELVTGGELFDRIAEGGPYSEKDAAKVVREIVETVDYLHKNGIVHRDLKPENLLYATPEPNAAIKISDFGLSKIIPEDDFLQTACGTPGYVAPEVLRGDGYSHQVDMWSIGIIMYILLCGFPPFYSDNITVLYQLIIEAKFEFPTPYWDNVSDSAKDLISRLLVVDPEKRYSTEQTLIHPWIAGGKAPDSSLGPGVNDRFKAYNAKRKFKGAVNVVIANNRLTSAVKNSPRK